MLSGPGDRGAHSRARPGAPAIAKTGVRARASAGRADYSGSLLSGARVDGRAGLRAGCLSSPPHPRISPRHDWKNWREYEPGHPPDAQITAEAYSPGLGWMVALGYVRVA